MSLRQLNKANSHNCRMENQEVRVSFGVLYVGVVTLSGQTQLDQLQLQFCKYFANTEISLGLFLHACQTTAEQSLKSQLWPKILRV